jgi:hypothetical protein
MIRYASPDHPAGFDADLEDERRSIQERIDPTPRAVHPDRDDPRIHLRVDRFGVVEA